MSLRESVRRHLAPLVEPQESPPPDWDARLAHYLELLHARNQVVNLVSRKTDDDWVERHLLPSLAALLIVPARTIVRVLDVGTGGGLPGIPLKILRPEARVDLVDATRKKVTFVEECIRDLALEDTRAHWCRVEEPSVELRARAPFDVALARAVGSDAILARATSRLLARPRGALWVFSAPGSSPHDLVWMDAAGRPVTALRSLSS